MFHFHLASTYLSSYLLFPVVGRECLGVPREEMRLGLGAITVYIYVILPDHLRTNSPGWSLCSSSPLDLLEPALDNPLVFERALGTG